MTKIAYQVINICLLTYNPVETVHCFLDFFFFLGGGGSEESVLFPTQTCSHKSTESFLDGTS